MACLNCKILVRMVTHQQHQLIQREKHLQRIDNVLRDAIGHAHKREDNLRKRKEEPHLSKWHQNRIQSCRSGKEQYASNYDALFGDTMQEQFSQIEVTTARSRRASLKSVRQMDKLMQNLIKGKSQMTETLKSTQRTQRTQRGSARESQHKATSIRF